MTIAQAQLIAASAGTLAEAMLAPVTPVKDHGNQPLPRVDPIRHAWASLNKLPLPRSIRRFNEDGRLARW